MSDVTLDSSAAGDHDACAARHRGVRTAGRRPGARRGGPVKHVRRGAETSPSSSGLRQALLRGWIHEIFFLLHPRRPALVAFRHRRGPPRRRGSTARASSALYGVSAAYHRGPWDRVGAAYRTGRPRPRHAIFALIAATCHPFCIPFLDGAPQWLFLGAIWFVAFAGLTSSPHWIR